MLMSSRWYKFEGNPDFTSIDSKQPITPDSQYINFIDQWAYLRPEFKDELEEIRCILSTSMGPNGPAMPTSLEDLSLLSSEQMDDIRTLHEGGKMFLERFMPVKDVKLGSQKHGENYVPSTRKLSIVEDKEGKRRVIAIMDYWTQCALKPYHNILNKILRTIPSDCTFNQNNFKTILTKLDGKTKVFSIDLKSATDNMPASLQALILSKLYGENRAKA